MVVTRVVLSFVLSSGSIVVGGYTSVNDGSSIAGQNVKGWSDGSPMPLPVPKNGSLVADGSPMPLPEPKGGALVADGSPMPLPEPKAVGIA